MPNTKPKTNPKPTRSRKTPPAQVKPRARKPSAALSRDAQIQNALYRIADAASAVTDMQEFYATLHRIVGELMYAKNFFIALHDKQSDILSFPYFADETGDTAPQPQPLGNFRGATNYIFRVMKPVRATRAFDEQMIARGEYELSGTSSEDGLAVPFVIDEHLKGLIVLQSYTPEIGYSDADLDVLNFVAQHIATALARARAIEETKQRNAELHVINSIQQGLASKLEFKAIINLVGESVRDIFDAQVTFIALVDHSTNMVHLPYYVEDGKRFEEEPFPLGEGLTAHVIRTRTRLIINENFLELAVKLGAKPSGSGRICKSWTGIPIFAAERVIGMLSLQNYEHENAFSDSAVNLMTTIASSLGIALENARLFDETQRLLKETEQRAAELEIINSVQQGLASKLDMQGIYDLVGDKIREIFDAQAVVLVRLDHENELIYRPYITEKDKRIEFPPGPFHGLARHLIQERHTILINENWATRLRELGGITSNENETKACLLVPFLVAGHVMGWIALENLEHENAFTESDVRLLETLANSMSVALENARLFDETQRLLKESEQRAAELQIINAVQQGLASKLDMQGIYELVGEKIREIFDAQVVVIGYRDEAANLSRFPYAIERGERVYFPPITLPPGKLGLLGDYFQKTRQPLVINQDFVERAAEFPFLQNGEGEKPKSLISVPIFSGNNFRGAISLQNLDHENGFSASDVGLLQTLTNSMSVALENARLFEETERRARETAATSEILRIISQSPGDEKPVLDAIAVSAARLCDSSDAQVFRVNGNVLEQVASFGDVPNLPLGEGIPLNRGSVSGRAFLDRRTLHISDILTLPPEEFPEAIALAKRFGHRTTLVVPMIREGAALGVILLRRMRVEPFNETQVRLLETFADQAVIAIENARLFDEIQSGKQYNEAIVQTSPVAIITVDLDFNVVSWNPGAEQLFGYTAQEAIGRNIYDLHSKLDQLRSESTQYGEEIKSGRRIRAITQRTRKDGSLVDVEMSGVPVMVEGKQLGNILIYHDITELARARREAELANQAKSAFLATMSHEIRTPMNAIIGMSGLMLDTQLNPEQREYAEIIRSSGDALLTIINDILDFSKIEAGKMEIENQPLDLRETVEGALDLVATRAAEQGLDLAYQFDANVPQTIVGDATRLRQILLNLLSNAVKFTEKGEVVLNVTTNDERRTTNPTLSLVNRPSSVVLHFSLRDTGIGIAPAQLARLFQSFSQADASTARKYGGTGLGLAISKRLTELMGGTMWAESAGKGHGSTFHFTIETKALATPRRTRRELDSTQPLLQEKRALIVDDNATNRRILVTYLRNWGMLTRDTASPHEALQWIQRGDPFDVAILDMHMSEMDGVELGHAIRNQRDARALPLVLFSSLGQREQADLFHAQVSKPIKPSQLYDTLVNLFVQETLTISTGESKMVLDPTMSQKHPLRILLAEDNAVNQKLALRLLRQMGYRADVAANGIEVLESLERGAQFAPYDAILMDVQMPEMDGLEASRQINKRYAQSERPRIIAMTANAMQGDREMCLAAGMDDYLTKPIRVEELVAALFKTKPHRDQGQRTTDDAILDSHVFANLKATMGADFIGELIDTFLEDSPQLIAEMKRAHAANDMDSFRRAAHSLKSNSNNFGALQLAAQAQELEGMARERNLTGAEEKIARIEKAYEKVKRVLEQRQ